MRDLVVARLVDIILTLLRCEIDGKHIPRKRLEHRLDPAVSIDAGASALSMMMNSSAPFSEFDLFRYALFIAANDIEHLLVQ